MKYRYVTIEREYGSGGTQIAQKLSEQLCIPLYGRRLLELVAEEMNTDVDKIEEFEEKASDSFLFSVVMMNRIASDNFPSKPGEGGIYFDERRIIRDLANAGPAIFVGHCASLALADRAGVLKIFLYADDTTKNKRVREEYHIAEHEVESTRRRFDKKRSAYFEANTGMQWRNPQNYDLMLNTALGIDTCVRIICEAAGGSCGPADLQPVDEDAGDEI